MSDEEIVDSLIWHYMVSNKGLDGAQLAEHKRRGACPACEHRTPLGAISGATEGAQVIAG